MWSADIDRNYRNTVNAAVKQANDNFSTVIDRTPASVLNLPGATDQVNQSKQLIEQAVQTVRRSSTDVSNTIDQIVAAKARLRGELTDNKKEVEHTQQAVREARELNKLRTEQAEELKKKYTSNYHTSYLGLWRPLHEHTHMGLIVASVVFALIALASVGYFIYEKMHNVSTGQAPALSTQTGMFGGVFRSARRK